jgi:sensor histidine kinase YesM
MPSHHREFRFDAHLLSFGATRLRACSPPSTVMPMADAALDPSPPKVNWRIAVTCTVVLTLLFAVQQWLGGNVDISLPVALERQVVIWFTWLGLLPAVIAAARKYPIVGAPRKRWLLRQLGLALFFSALHSLLVSLIRHMLGINLVGSIIEGAMNLFFMQPGRNFLTYAFIATAYHAVAYHKAVRERDLRAVRLEVDLAEAKLASLESRLRPHFLFNTLNTVASLIREDPVAAETMLGQLSELLRASLRTDPGAEIRLDEELRLVDQYLAIQRARFHDRLTVGLRATDDARQALVPQLILQPIVENAVRHGIGPRESGGSVWVLAERPDGRLRLVVEDDGVGIGQTPSANAGTGIGLGGLRSRLTHLYGDDHRVEVAPRLPSGTRVTIEIPYRTESYV